MPKTIIFSDYPEFRPNLTPRDIFKLGSFGGTYWRNIYSSITKREYKNQHLKFPMSWWKGIPEYKLTSNKCNCDINKYKVNSGLSLKYWEDHKWISKYDPYGWVMWYCNFYNGRRCPDDERQIKRWLAFAGTNGRFRKQLINAIYKKNTDYNNFNIKPVIRQALQHWGYQLTKKDYENEFK